MLGDITAESDIYIVCGRTDMRKSTDGLCANSQGGAEASATVYSIVEMAEAYNLNIFKYLSYVLEQRIDADSADEGLLDSLAPWNKDVVSLCANDTERQ